MGKPSIFTERSNIGSKDELDEYGVWVKSEPEDINEESLTASNSAEGFNIGMELTEDLPSFDIPVDEHVPETAPARTKDFASGEPAQNPKKTGVENENLSTEILLKIANELSTIKSEIANLKAQINAINSEKLAAVSKAESVEAEAPKDIAKDSGEFPVDDIGDIDDKIPLETDKLQDMTTSFDVEIGSEAETADTETTPGVIDDAGIEIDIDDTQAAGIENEITIDDKIDTPQITDIESEITIDDKIDEPLTADTENEIAIDDTFFSTDNVLSDLSLDTDLDDVSITDTFKELDTDISFDETLNESELPAISDSVDTAVDSAETIAQAPAAETVDEPDNEENNEEISIDLDLNDLDANDTAEDADISLDDLSLDQLVEKENENITVPNIEQEITETPVADDSATLVTDDFSALVTDDSAFDIDIEQKQEVEAPSIDGVPVVSESVKDSVVEDTIVEDTVIEDTNKDKSTDVISSPQFKKELQVVLTYMDQLLEALPESKIEEFARSDQFEIYKKVFKDLGLV